MNIFIPGSSIFKTYFPPLKSAEIGCVTGGSGAPVPDHYYELSRCKGASCFFRKMSSPPSPFAPIHFDETQSKLPFHPLAKGKISPRLLEFRQEREKREDSCDLDPLHWNVELRSPLSLSLLLIHAFVRRRNTERGSRSIGSRIRRSLGPPPTTRFRDPFSFIYHCLLRHFHGRTRLNVTRVDIEGSVGRVAREGSPRPDSAVLQGANRSNPLMDHTPPPPPSPRYRFLSLLNPAESERPRKEISKS